MKNLLLISIIALTSFTVKAQAEVDITKNINIDPSAQCLAFMQHSEKKLHAKELLDLCQLTAGKAMLIVNTASHCGFTPQFTALEALHKEYQEQGLVVIGFPSDDFFQEEDDEKDTADICFVNYGVTFTMLSPVHVYGSEAHPIFKVLAEKTTAPKWNFYKYLVSADGKTVKHFNSRVKPDSDIFINAINEIL
ncbi:glutathione peroxidase [Colwellia sp. MB02u-18]|uniref:glutathione peroxidase n=1 Tax=unclassified Colwellia TaxID=196834 RepID=UPI0015F40881|nr:MULTISPECIES: glutathione peroxidase [unclassified Colwellia]MBA6222933.1 glutathione peroxidase [Colwellia sp. MB3u-45]MBA6267765.1 glutathione peroxidase [Colwellia sp. MB3u-43]MBA6322321.1 glutathione peroxidase [Colwellia sp. MB02u-19]MBA6324320.1 glutathione peroxidase [Colwellia sp. MB02u-18]MBA6332476.1 glutathione peroxidase [Colwellia sp. MB02u-12]